MNLRLAQDFDAGVEPLTLYKTVECFLMKLGERDAVEIDPADIQMRALPLIKSGLEYSAVLPRGVFDEDFDELECRTKVTDGSVELVERVQRFSGELGEILLVDATWRLEFSLLYRESQPSEQAQWLVIDALEASGRVQVYLGPSKPGASPGLFIAAQLKPTQTVSLDGAAVTIWSSSQD